MNQTSISTHQQLLKGDTLKSANGEYVATFQYDNNFVIYKTFGGATWATDTFGRDAFRLVLQEDGNLVMYNRDNKPLWNTSTHGNYSLNMKLTITNEGNLVLDKNGQTIWTSQTSKGVLL